MAYLVEYHVVLFLQYLYKYFQVLKKLIQALVPCDHTSQDPAN